MQERTTPTAVVLVRTLAGSILIGLACGAAAQTSSSANPKAIASQAVAEPDQADNLAWAHLSPRQRQALQPLAASWPKLSEAQKKKWIALSANYASLSVEAKERLHARMAEWAALTPKQRTQARLNFSQTQTVPTEDKAERWEIYQTLTPEQKHALAASAPKVPLAPHVKVPKKPASVPAAH